MKKHMGKKAAAFLLAVLMLTAAGCSGGGETASTTGGDGSQASTDGTEKKTFRIAVSLHPLTKDEDFNNKEIYKLAEEATNVHIEWMPIAAADATDKVNIMLTSDLPDAFLGLISSDQIASNMDSFADLAKDVGLLQAAQQAGAELLRQDPTLSQPQHERLRAQVAAVVHNVGGQIN